MASKSFHPALYLRAIACGEALQKKTGNALSTTGRCLFPSASTVGVNGSIPWGVEVCSKERGRM